MSNVKMDNIFSDLSVDELLNSLTAEIEATQKEYSTPAKNWSMDEIDELLGLKSEDKKPQPRQTANPEESKEEQEVNVPDIMISKPKAEPPQIKPEEQLLKQKTIDLSEKSDKQERGNATESETAREVKTAEIPDLEYEEEAQPAFDDNKTRVFDASRVKRIEPIKVKEDEEQPSQKSSLGIGNLFRAFSSVSNEEEDDVAEFNGEEGLSNNGTDTNIMELASEYVTDESKPQKQTLMDIEPTYNDSIIHNISRKRVEKVSKGIENDKYRSRFINRPVQNLEKTADYEALHFNDPQPKVERPGIIVKKKNFSNTADLEPIPTIISVEDELKNASAEKTRVVKGAKVEPPSEAEEIAGQIKLSGFEEPEEIEKIDEEVAEDSLKKARKEKLKSFKINTNIEDIPLENVGEPLSDESEEFEQSETAPNFLSEYIDNEYRLPKERPQFLQKLAKSSKASLIFACIEAVIFIISMVISTVSATSGTSVVGGSIVTNMLINILLLLFAGIFSIGTLIKGINGIIKLKPNAATGTVIIFLLCIIQCAVFIFVEHTSVIDSVIYAPVACFSFTVGAFSRYLVLKRALSNFEFCTGGTALSSTEKIAQEIDAFEIGRGLLLGEPDLRYSSKIIFPEKFMESSFSYDPADRISSKLVPSVLVASLVVAIISGIISKNAYVAFSAFVAVCCIGIPTFSAISSNLPLFLTNRKLNTNGCAILGYKPAIECAGTNAIVIDSSDLFKKGSCSIDGIKTFNSMRIDEAILDAAALVIESGGPLVGIFDGVILNRREILPPVESLAYEDRLGLSAWIQGSRVLLGSRDLLINHNVIAPEKEVEQKYIQKGKKVMYLAVAGKIAAMFVISYLSNEAIGHSLRKIEENGVTILVRTTDCNITEDLLCQYFGLPLSAVKIISPVSGDIFVKYRKTVLDKSDSGIFHKGTEDSFLNSLVQALRLNKLVSINSVVQIIYAAVAVAIFALLSFLSALPSIGAGQIIAFQALWALIACLIPVFKKS